MKIEPCGSYCYKQEAMCFTMCVINDKPRSLTSIDRYR